MSHFSLNFFLFWTVKALGKCVQLPIKLCQTNEFDDQFAAFALTIKQDFVWKNEKRRKKILFEKFDGEQTFHQTKSANQTKFGGLMTVCRICSKLHQTIFIKTLWRVQNIDDRVFWWNSIRNSKSVMSFQNISLNPSRSSSLSSLMMLLK